MVSCDLADLRDPNAMLRNTHLHCCCFLLLFFVSCASQSNFSCLCVCLWLQTGEHFEMVSLPLVPLNQPATFLPFGSGGFTASEARDDSGAHSALRRHRAALGSRSLCLMCLFLCWSFQPEASNFCAGRAALLRLRFMLFGANETQTVAA